jgi:hypothetical protein
VVYTAVTTEIMASGMLVEQQQWQFRLGDALPDQQAVQLASLPFCLPPKFLTLVHLLLFSFAYGKQHDQLNHSN